jgi:ribosomal protein S27E
MQIDPMQEWLRLTQEYRAMSDEELLEIRRDFADLTDVAQQVLAAELRSRGLDKKIAEERQNAAPGNSPWAKQEASPFVDRARVAMQGRVPLGGILGNNTMAPVPDVDEGSEVDDDVPHEYTWKTMLCEGMEYDQAWQIQEVLRRAGIESWIERAGGGRASRFANELDGDLRVKVAADELDRARAIIANPIPQDVIDESHETVPEYESPRCPGCGAEDPVLESAEPVNAWKCESCGREWTDPAGESRPVGPFT